MVRIFLIFVTFLIPYCFAQTPVIDLQAVLGASNVPSPTGQAWTTELRLVNLSTTPANVTLTAYPSDGSTAAPSTTVINPGQPLVYSDVLSGAFGLTQESGAILVQTDQPLTITGFKSTPGPNGGVIGTALAVVDESDFLDANTIGDSIWLAQSADPSSGLSTVISVFLSAPNSQAQVRLFDPTGAMITTQTVSGGPQNFDIPVGTLVSNDLPVARAEVLVVAGRATAALELSDNITHDRMAAAFTGLETADTDLTLSGVLHQSGANGAPVETDVRIANPGNQLASLTITSASGKSTMTLKAGSMVEIPDMLNSLNATGDSPAAVEFVSTSPLLVMGRTTTPSPFGALGTVGGIVGEIHAADSTSNLFTQDYTALLPGVRPSGTTSLVSRTDAGGVTAQLTLRDATAAVLATDPTLTLNPSGSRMDSLASLFPGAVIPMDGSIQIQPVTGEMSLASLHFDSTTGDPSYRSAEVPQPFGCAGPSVDLFAASQVTLAAAGAVTLSWQASYADSVSISPGQDGLNGAGSLNVNVSASATFTLTATNGCGTDTAQVYVTVGPPQLTGVAAIDPTSGAVLGNSGSPGQMVTMQFQNLADPSTISGLAFLANGITGVVNVLSIDQSGNVQAVVPLWLNTNFAEGYETGLYQVSAIAGNQLTAPVPFTITPLTLPDDPVGAFQSYLQGFESNLAAYYAAGASDADTADTIAAVQTAMGPIMQSLDQMLSDLMANGQATVFYDNDPAAPPTVVKASDLAILVAYNNNLVASQGIGAGMLPTDEAASEGRVQPRVADVNTCLAQNNPYLSWLIHLCKGSTGITNTYLRMQGSVIDSFVKYVSDPKIGGPALQTAEQAKELVDKFMEDTPVGLAFDALQKAYFTLKVVCLVYPIQLNRFTINPSRIPYNPHGKIATGVQVVANFGAQSTVSSVRMDEEAKDQARADSQFKQGNLPAAWSYQLSVAIAQRNDAVLAGVVASVESTYNLPNSRPIPVGSCDLDYVFASKNSYTDQYTPHKSILERDPEGYAVPVSAPHYHYYGRRSKAETICIVPMVTNFLFPENIENLGEQYFYSSSYPGPLCKLHASVRSKSVSGGVHADGSAIVAPADNVVYPVDTGVGPGTPLTVSVTKAEYTGVGVEHLDTTGQTLAPGQPYSFSGEDAIARGNVQISQTGPSTWQMNLSLVGHDSPDTFDLSEDLNATISTNFWPVPADTTGTIQITGTAGGANCKSAAFIVQNLGQPQVLQGGDLQTATVNVNVPVGNSVSSSVQLTLLARAGATAESGFPPDTCTGQVTLQIVTSPSN